MNKQKVWKKALKCLMPPNRRLIKSKWLFKIKHNGVYWAHLVACGYSQVPGVIFSENYSLVVNNIIFLILLLTVIYFGYSAIIVNMETDFLYGELEEEIYMEYPQGMSGIGQDDCIILNKCIYTLVQAVRQYYKKAAKILKNLGFVGGNVDPCLYIEKSAKGIVYVALYLDNNFMVGNNEVIDDAIATFKNNGLVLKVMEGLQGYLSAKLNLNRQNEGLVRTASSHQKYGQEIWQIC